MFLCKGVDCFTKANLRNAMDIHQSKCSGLSLFSGSRCQVLLKSTQCAMPSLAFYRCYYIVLEIGSNLFKFGKNSWPSRQLHYQKGLFSR